MTEDEVQAVTGRESAGASSPFAALLERERSLGFDHLRGSRAEIAVPIRQALVDRLVTSAIGGHDATHLRVELLEGARLGVEVIHRVLGVPASARTVLEVEREVDLRRQRVVLHHSDGLLWRTVRTVAATLGLLPAGVSLGAGSVEVDLRAFAARGGWGDLLPHVRRAVIHGPADGLFAIEVDVEIGDVPAVGDLGAGTAEPGVGPARARPSIAPAQLLADLAGARARLELHVDESLVNDALEDARRVAASRRIDRASSWPLESWASFVRDARVRFEAGRMVVLLEAELPEPTAAS